MAVYPVKIESHEMWAIYHSSSDTLFSPVFREELAAFMFAAIYGERGTDRNYSDVAQESMALHITMFLDATLPTLKHERQIPDSWKAELDPNPYDANDPDELQYFNEWKSTFSVDELLQSWGKHYRFVLDGFNQWKADNNIK